MSKDLLYIKWKNMRSERVPEWDSFSAFRTAVYPAPEGATILSRIDRDLPFGPDNFKWLSRDESFSGENNPNYKAAKITTICPTCGREITSFQASPRIYCSRECAAAAQTKPWPCAVCGDLFIPETGASRRYCSFDCEEFDRLEKEEADQRRMEEAARRKRTGVYVWRLCKICGSRMRLRPSDVDKGRKYCSRTCYGKSVSLRQMGDKHHNWKGGVSGDTDRIRKSSLYDEWRAKVFLRDEYTCQSCFDKGGEIQAHHLVAYKDDPRLRLKVRNGITLCKTCHRKWHVFNRKGLFVGLERELQKRAIARFKEAGFFVFNSHGHALQAAGVPDVFLNCFGLFAAVEFKVFPNFLTPLQKIQARAIKNSGGACFMVRSEDDIERVIDEMTRLSLGEG